VTFSGDLRWNIYISHISAKSNRALGFIKRNLDKCSEKIEQSAYFTLVRLTLNTRALLGIYMEKINGHEKMQR